MRPARHYGTANRTARAGRWAWLAALGGFLCCSLPLAADLPPAGGTAGNLFRYFQRPAAAVSTTPHPAVVRVLVDEAHSQANGSGTLVAARDRHGLVVTNWHVVRDAAGKIEVVFPDGYRSAATVLRTDSDWDLAALLIWRPATTPPVPISTVAPQPGDPLTIAGYGPGDYRAVTGKCTQYVAPSPHHPFEIVELSAQARQGDSGGPILNERGELAGVLFGASRGSTSGSYCGRVRAFLTPIWPDLDAASAPSEAPQVPTPITAPPPPTLPSTEPAPGFSTPLVGFTPAPTQLQPLPSTGASAAAFEPQSVGSAAALPEQPLSAPESATTPPIVYTPLPPLEPDPPDTFNWRGFAGETKTEQAKTVLAIIGLLTVWGHVARWLTR